MPWVGAKCGCTKQANAHAGSRARVTSMGGLYDAATLHALCWTKGDTGYEFYTGKYTNTSQFLCFWACCRAFFFSAQGFGPDLCQIMAWNGQCVRILCPCSPLPHAHGVLLLALVSLLFNCIELLCYESRPKVAYTIPANAHAGSRARVTSMGGLNDAATLHAL